MEQFKLLSKSIANGLWDRRLVPIAIICVSLAIGDVVSRFKLIHHSAASDTGADTNLPGILEFERLGGDLLKSYTAKLPNYQNENDKTILPDEIDTETDEVLSVDINERHGFWRNDNFSFKLLGVIEHHETVAVLDRFDHISGERDLIEARVGDKIGGFVMSNIAGNLVTLEVGLSESRLLRMFERADAEDVLISE